MKVQRPGRVETPCIQQVPAFAADQVVVASTGEQDVEVRRGSVTRIAKQSVVALVAVQDVATASTVQPIACVRSRQDVVARSAVDHADPITAALRQLAEINSVHAGDKPDFVIA